MRLADIYAQSKGFRDSSTMVSYLNRKSSNKMSDMVEGMILAEIIGVLRSIDKHNDSNNQEGK